MFGTWRVESRSDRCGSQVVGSRAAASQIAGLAEDFGRLAGGRRNGGPNSGVRLLPADVGQAPAWRGLKAHSTLRSLKPGAMDVTVSWDLSGTGRKEAADAAMDFAGSPYLYQ